MPIIGKKGHGDLIITLEILVPAKISKAEKALYEEIITLEK
jgi:DnaJ-class molecular chaperone